MKEQTGYKALPKWVVSDTGPSVLPQTKRGRTDYLEKTFRSVRHKMMLEQAVGKGRNTLLTKINGPEKCICFFLLILAVGLSHSLFFLGLLQISLVAMALYSGISFFTYMFRVGLPVLFFSGIALFPSIFNIVTPGDMVATIYTGYWPQWAGGHPVHIAVTVQGLKGMSFVLLRSMDSLGLATILLRTTSWTTITGSLSNLKVPNFIIMILDITYRTIYLYLPVLEDYLLGRKSRMTGKELYKDSIRWIGASVADLLRITGAYGEDLFEALRSRGFVGEYTSQISWRWGRTEVLMGILSISLLLLSLVL